jgi:ABC-type antimicrobial peptide transport system permease subunit
MNNIFFLLRARVKTILSVVLVAAVTVGLCMGTALFINAGNLTENVKKRFTTVALVNTGEYSRRNNENTEPLTDEEIAEQNEKWAAEHEVEIEKQKSMSPEELTDYVLAKMQEREDALRKHDEDYISLHEKIEATGVARNDVRIYFGESAGLKPLLSPMDRFGGGYVSDENDFLYHNLVMDITCKEIIAGLTIPYQLNSPKSNMVVFEINNLLTEYSGHELSGKLGCFFESEYQRESYRMEVGKRYVFFAKNFTNSYNALGETRLMTGKSNAEMVFHQGFGSIEIPDDAVIDFSSLEKIIETMSFLREKYGEYQFAYENYMAAIWRYVEYNISAAHSVTVTTTDSLDALVPFNNVTQYILEGRGFTAEENGNVCVISSALAEANGYKIGDKLSFKFRNMTLAEVLGVTGSTSMSINYLAENLDVVGEGTYEIVGIYHAQSWENNGTQHYMSPNNIIIPSRSFTPPKETDKQPGTKAIAMFNTFIIPNDMAATFIDDLPDDVAQYVTLIDQGYSHVAPLLGSVIGNSRLIFIGSVAAWLVVVAVFLYLHIFRNRHAMGTMRSLGVAKKRVFAMFLSLCAVFWLASAAVGYVVSGSVYGSLEEKIYSDIFNAEEYNEAFSDLGSYADQGYNEFEGQEDQTSEQLFVRIYEPSNPWISTAATLIPQAAAFGLICSAAIAAAARKRVSALLKGD